MAKVVYSRAREHLNNHPAYGDCFLDFPQNSTELGIFIGVAVFPNNNCSVAVVGVTRNNNYQS